MSSTPRGDRRYEVRRSRLIEGRRLSLSLRGEEGAAAVEFALIGVVLFLVLFGILQYGIWLSQYEVYQGAAREGARLGAVRCGNPSNGCTDPTVIDTRVTQAASPYGITGPVTKELSANGGATWTSGTCMSSTVGQLQRVSWTQTFSNSIFALIPSFGTRVIKGVFRCE
jgi:Flp pilus assembly protein TadG